MRRTRLAWFAALFFAPVWLWGQGGEVLSLDDCIQLALKNNSQLRKAVRQVSLASTNVVTAWSNVLPRLNSSFSAGKYISGPRTRLQDVPVGFDPTTGRVIYEQREIVQSSVERNNYGARLSLNYNLFDFGQSWFRIWQARSSAVAAEDEYEATRQSVLLAVKQRYFELLKAQELVRVYEMAVEAAQRQLERTQAMYELGSVAQADVYKARVNLGQQQISLINQRNLVEIAKANLNTVMGREPTAPLHVLEYPGSADTLSLTLEEAVRIALAKNPQIRARDNRLRASRMGVRAAQANFLPSVGVSVSYSRDNEFLDKVVSKHIDRDYSVVVGLSVSLNLFNGLADKADLDREQTNYRIAEEDLEETQRNVIAEVKRSYLNLKAYREIAELNQENLRSAEEDLRLAEERYRLGSGTLLEVIDAQVALTRARATFVSSHYDALIARAQLEAAMGVLAP
ncbi:MAG: TolC family protein [candidate division KSB1 bacterium]|nr:TolC family protein [candidate division KSB1 bacterium]